MPLAVFIVRVSIEMKVDNGRFLWEPRQASAHCAANSQPRLKGHTVDAEDAMFDTLRPAVSRYKGLLYYNLLC